MADVIIVGGGLAGLVCARELLRRGVSAEIFEASDGVGGRVRTDEVDGFLLDRGFQVLLTAYPEAQRQLDYAKLELHSFEPGALVRFGGAFHHVADPRRRPMAVIDTLFSPMGTFEDQARVAWLALSLLSADSDDLLRRTETTTLERLRQAGMSPSIIERFMRPFFAGIFLEEQLRTSSRKFDYVFQMFARGAAALPSRGMGAISKQIASTLPTGTVHVNSPAEQIDGTAVRLADGSEHSARALVLATDVTSANRLLGLTTDERWNPNICFYYAASRPPIAGNILLLNGEGLGPVNNVAIHSEVSPSYAPPGASLICASVVGSKAAIGVEETNVREQMQTWFGPQVQTWQFVKRYDIPHALPSTAPADGGLAIRTPRLRPGLYIAGDYCDTASSNGAMLSGRRAAEAIAYDFGSK